MCELLLHSFEGRLRNEKSELCPIQTFLLAYINSSFQGCLHEKKRLVLQKGITLCRVEGEKNLDSLYAHWVEAQVKKFCSSATMIDWKARVNVFIVWSKGDENKCQNSIIWVFQLYRKQPVPQHRISFWVLLVLFWEKRGVHCWRWVCLVWIFCGNFIYIFLFFSLMVFWTKSSSVSGKNLCKPLMVELNITIFQAVLGRIDWDYTDECSGEEVKG